MGLAIIAQGLLSAHFSWLIYYDSYLLLYTNQNIIYEKNILSISNYISFHHDITQLNQRTH